MATNHGGARNTFQSVDPDSRHCPAVLALLLLAALVTAGPPWRRALGLALACLLLVGSLWLPGSPLFRGVIALLAFWGAARVLDLARDPRPYTAGERLAFVLAVIDTRTLVWRAPRVDVAALAKAAVWIPIGLLAITTAAQLHDSGPLRWVLGVLTIYALGEALEGLLRGILGLLGATSPPLHRTPIAARSLREFWGERWNLVVNRWLRVHCYLPLARRHQPALGLALAFLASAAIHAWFIGVALGPTMAARMGLYFVIQGVLLALEGPLGVTRWPAPAGRAWMLACTLLPSPLFVEPILRLFARPLLLV